MLSKEQHKVYMRVVQGQNVNMLCVTCVFNTRRDREHASPHEHSNTEDSSLHRKYRLNIKEFIKHRQLNQLQFI